MNKKSIDRARETIDELLPRKSEEYQTLKKGLKCLEEYEIVIEEVRAKHEMGLRYFGYSSLDVALKILEKHEV